MLHAVYVAITSSIFNMSLVPRSQNVCSCEQPVNPIRESRLPPQRKTAPINLPTATRVLFNLGMQDELYTSRSQGSKRHTNVTAIHET